MNRYEKEHNSKELELSDEQIALINSAHKIISLNPDRSETHPTDLNFRKPASMIGYMANKLVAKIKKEEVTDNDENILERFETLITTTKILLKRQKPGETQRDSYGGAPIFLEQIIIDEIYKNFRKEYLQIYTEVIANTGMGGMGDVAPVKREKFDLLSPLDSETINKLQSILNEALQVK